MQAQKDWNHNMAETERRKFKTDRIRQQIFIGYGKKTCDKRTGIAGSSVGIGTISVIY